MAKFWRMWVTKQIIFSRKQDFEAYFHCNQLGRPKSQFWFHKSDQLVLNASSEGKKTLMDWKIDRQIERHV